jgi:alkyl hydroperoxide reductase subunit F
MARDNITIIRNAATQRITASNGKVDGLDYEDRETGESHHVDFAGVFVQIGLIPNSQFLEGIVDLTPHGEVIIDDKCRTSAEGIFACGDLTTVPYKQIIVSMGEGAKASLAAFEHLLITNPVVDEAKKAA